MQRKTPEHRIPLVNILNKEYELPPLVDVKEKYETAKTKYLGKKEIDELPELRKTQLLRIDVEMELVRNHQALITQPEDEKNVANVLMQARINRLENTNYKYSAQMASKPSKETKSYLGMLLKHRNIEREERISERTSWLPPEEALKNQFYGAIWYTISEILGSYRNSKVSTYAPKIIVSAINIVSPLKINEVKNSNLYRDLLKCLNLNEAIFDEEQISDLYAEGKKNPKDEKIQIAIRNYERIQHILKSLSQNYKKEQGLHRDRIRKFKFDPKKSNQEKQDPASKLPLHSEDKPVLDLRSFDDEVLSKKKLMDQMKKENNERALEIKAPLVISNELIKALKKRFLTELKRQQISSELVADDPKDIQQRINEVAAQKNKLAVGEEVYNLPDRYLSKKLYKALQEKLKSVYLTSSVETILRDDFASIMEELLKKEYVQAWKSIVKDWNDKTDMKYHFSNYSDEKILETFSFNIKEDLQKKYLEEDRKKISNTHKKALDQFTNTMDQKTREAKKNEAQKVFNENVKISKYDKDEEKVTNARDAFGLYLKNIELRKHLDLLIHPEIKKLNPKMEDFKPNELEDRGYEVLYAEQIAKTNEKAERLNSKPKDFDSQKVLRAKNYAMLYPERVAEIKEKLLKEHLQDKKQLPAWKLKDFDPQQVVRERGYEALHAERVAEIKAKLLKHNEPNEKQPSAWRLKESRAKTFLYFQDHVAPELNAPVEYENGKKVKSNPNLDRLKKPEPKATAPRVKR